MERAAVKGLKLNFEAKTSPVFVMADEVAAMQVIDNIVSNAVKYSPNGENKNIWVRVVESNKAYRIEVQDEGPGLTDADKDKLFGHFARLSAQPTGGEHSTGLGLSIVKKMVEAMNGKIWCESEKGKGATFIVELPGA
jgi:signal transduction histidine kinase